MKEITSVTYLTTKEDYVKFRQAGILGGIDSQDKSLTRVIGIFLVVVGFIVQCVSIPTLTIFEKNTVTVLLAVSGIVTALYYDLIKPAFIKAEAEKFHNKNTDKMISNTVTVYENMIEVKNYRYTAKLPFEAVCACYENDDVFVLYLSSIEFIFIPKRNMETDAVDVCGDVLKQNIKKYVKKTGKK